MVRDMVGRAIDDFAVKTTANPHGDRLLSSTHGRWCFNDVSFELHRGEVLCFAGLIGSRRTDVGLSLFGILPATSGTIELDGATVTISSPQQAMELGIAYVSEDRRKLGLAMTMSIFANTSLASLKKFLRRFGLTDRCRDRHGGRLSQAARDPLTGRADRRRQAVGR
jgi:rhamnose transport system ATP-binding protein